jgi:hypothetical protein
MMAGTITLSLQEAARGRRVSRMDRIDALPQEWRELVHEYGYCLVDAMRCCGIKEVRHVRHLVETVLNELSPIRGSLSSQGARTTRENCLVMVPREPTKAMIEASMATVCTFDAKITKRDKHRQRLQAAIDAAVGAMSRRLTMTTIGIKGKIECARHQESSTSLSRQQ